MITSVGGIVAIFSGNVMFYFQSLRTLKDENNSDLNYTMLDFSDDFRTYMLSILLIGIGTFILAGIELFKLAGFLLIILSCLLLYSGFKKGLIDPSKSSRINRWYAILVLVQLVFGISFLFASLAQ